MDQFARYPSLQERSVFVTGGGSGIGASIVEHFVTQGSKVCFVDLNEESSRALLEKLTPGAAHAPLFIPCDLKDIPALQRAIARAAEAHGPIRALINNAANDTRHKWDEVTVELFDSTNACTAR